MRRRRRSPIRRRIFRGTLSNGTATLEPSTAYPNPWRGGTLHLRDAVDYMLTGSLAVLDVAAKYREQLLYGIYQVGARQIEKGKTRGAGRVSYSARPARSARRRRSSSRR